MNDLQKGRWLDRGFHLLLILLVGLWILYPPQRIIEERSGKAPHAAEILKSGMQKATP